MSTVLNLHTHDALSVSGRADSVREALEQRVPKWAEQLEYVTYVRALHVSMVNVLSTPVNIMRSNPYFYAGGASKLNSVRTLLIDTMLMHAEMMSDASCAQANSGWTMLMLTWLVVGQLSIALERLRDNVPVWLDGTVLERNELLTTSGGIADVARMSMLELRAALNVLRDRIFMIDTFDATLMRYILALELRAAQFAHQTVSYPSDYDCLVWLRCRSSSSNRQVSLGYLATMAWWFVWLKRHCRWYLNMSAPSFYADVKRPGRVVTTTTMLTGRLHFIQFVTMYARTLNTVDHEQEFAAMAKTYAASIGDVEEHSYIYGMGGIEEATVQDIVSRRRTPEATSYIGLRKLKRPLLTWIESQQTRERLVGRGRFVGGGASCEAFIEQLAILHVIDALFVAKLKLKWARWFVVAILPQGNAYETTVKRAITRGLPFIVQRAGRFGCIVPQLPPNAPVSRRIIEQRLGLPNPSDEPCASVLYDGADVYDAIIVWAKFMLDAWDGRVVRANKRLGPLLRQMLTPISVARSSSPAIHTNVISVSV